jgi:hypothetical protein
LTPGYPKPANAEWSKRSDQLAKDPVLSTNERLEQEHQKAMADFQKRLTQPQQEAWTEVEKAMREGIKQYGSVRIGYKNGSGPLRQPK